ncbi:flagellar hook-associated protein 3 [Alkalilimnicola ehrlichii]|uniref:Flagellar hook-associated protein 3 n=1 Tax=Alkalilimnicola ehrlichii TaxID=351052 RepID=A0A3E0WTK2_9GAMM|nr:flagellar hook-associated protein FlgL [Alkalilimnicola ehrlichii]RFA28555.1 flagellar hook-associated protein 3 [Alkalilimnicola ehrlichii]RFA35719.1 flagellar hook-associated protein 3 [Alkalilimnicola ehrlichii]
MRISTGQFQAVSLQSMLERQAQLSKTQQQLATGRRVLTPADDPAAAARALDLTRSIDELEQYQKNADRALMRMNMEDTVLDQVGDIIIRLNTLAMQAKNDTNGPAERALIGEEVKELLQATVQLGNTMDGTGEYLFGGYKSQTPPFVFDGDGDVEYQGDEGERRFKVGPSREVTIANSGQRAFMDIPDGEGGTRSLFETMNNMLNALQPDDPAAIDIHEDLGQVMADFQRATEHVLENRARVGGRINVIESEMEGSSMALVELKAALSAAEDLDYAEAISRFTLELVGLEASQMSYMKIQGLSLFNYI